MDADGHSRPREAGGLMGLHHWCTIKHAEELAHAAYLLGRKEEAEERQKMARAFEARIKELDERLGKIDRPAVFAESARFSG